MTTPASLPQGRYNITCHLPGTNTTNTDTAEGELLVIDLTTMSIDTLTPNVTRSGESAMLVVGGKYALWLYQLPTILAIFLKAVQKNCGYHNCTKTMNWLSLSLSILLLWPFSRGKAQICERICSLLSTTYRVSSLSILELSDPLIWFGAVVFVKFSTCFV